jgi:hypothetical protein
MFLRFHGERRAESRSPCNKSYLFVIQFWVSFH